MKFLSILVLVFLPVFAADAPAEKSTRTFPLKYVDADQVRRLFSAYSYPMTANRDFNVLTVTAPAGFQTKVEEAIKEYDLQPIPARLRAPCCCSRRGRRCSISTSRPKRWPVTMK